MTIMFCFSANIFCYNKKDFKQSKVNLNNKFLNTRSLLTKELRALENIKKGK